MSQTQSSFSNDKGAPITKRHSSYETRSPNESDVPSKSDTFSRSDINIIRTTDFPSIIDSGRVNRRRTSVMESSSDEYYKNYDHDEVPVRDSSCVRNDLECNRGIHYVSKELTNSELDKLEIIHTVHKNTSKELNAESAAKKEEYNIKLFKTTVLEILDKFYGNMQDFELYKKKFHDILSKNKENIVDEMENFIKEMIQNIISSDSCMSSETNARNIASNERSTVYTFEDGSEAFTPATGDCHISTQKTVENYKNENYLTDSTFDDETSKICQSDTKTCNIYLLKGNSCIEIKMDDRNMLSEINIKNGRPEEIDQFASADNVKKLAAKRLQMTKYMKQVDRESSDKIIPVKISYAKNDIHSEENPSEMDENKPFIYKICNYLCKKLRKTSFG